jgi:hypothetical protein
MKELKMNKTMRATITEVSTINGSIALKVSVDYPATELNLLELLKLQRSDPNKYEEIKKTYKKQRGDFLSSIHLGNVELIYPKSEITQ